MFVQWIVSPQLDAVRLTGTTDNPAAVVSDLYHRVEYVPNEYMYGLDTFSYVVSDCPYRYERQSDISHVTLSVLGINNPPTLAVREFNVSGACSIAGCFSLHCRER